MIILTGGAGFIGSCFLATLNKKGITEVVVVDSLGSTEKWRNLVGKQYADFVNKEDLPELLVQNAFGDVTAIVHLGACTSTTERDADYLAENNFRYSNFLAEYCVEHNARFIYASSAATYGKGERGYSDGDVYDLRPLNMYGYSKQMFDQWVVQRKLEEQFVGIKFFNVFGPNEYHKADMASMVYKAYHQILATGSLQLFESHTSEYANGGQMRDFIYVKDCCDVLWKIFSDDTIAGIFNLGTGVARTWNDLAAAVFAAMGKESNIRYIPMPESLHAQYQNYTCANMGKLLAKVPHAFTPLEESITDYVKTYLATDYAWL